MSLTSYTQHLTTNTMDAGYPFRISSRTDDAIPVLPSGTSSVQPGMGLPYELWDHVVGFLELEPYPLLACCLTCRSFHEHAKGRLRKLFHPDLLLSNCASIDRLVDEIRTIPGRAQAINGFTLTGRPPLTFSLVPYRLASQLVNIRTLRLERISEISNVPMSTWSLYGRAFLGVVTLSLYKVEFPSFTDFVRFVTSFPSIQSLYLDSTSCTPGGAPPTQNTRRSNRRLKSLKGLTWWNLGTDGGRFLRSFSPWFSSTDVVIQQLDIDITFPSHPLGFLLLQRVHTHTQLLGFTTTHQFPPVIGETQESWRKSLGEWWLFTQRLLLIPRQVFSPEGFLTYAK